MVLRFLSASLFLCHFHLIVSLQQSYNFERMFKFAPGRKIMPNYRRFLRPGNPEAFPQALLLETPKPTYVRTPYKKIYQGKKRNSDVVVYNKDFDYPAQSTGHQLVVRTDLDCIITHLAIETSGAIPILLRGGVGYNHLRILVKANADKDLTGTIQAYCNPNTRDPYYYNSARREDSNAFVVNCRQI